MSIVERSRDPDRTVTEAARSCLVPPTDSRERGRVWREPVAPVFDAAFGRRTAFEALPMFDATAFGGGPPAGDRPEPPGTAARKLAIARYVEERIGARDLGIARVVERFGLSRPTLQRLFKDDGGFASYVRERRLRRAFASLARRGDAARPSVSAVAYAHGFADLATFSRAFRCRFGMAPRDVAANAVEVRGRGDADLRPRRPSAPP